MSEGRANRDGGRGDRGSSGPGRPEAGKEPPHSSWRVFAWVLALVGTIVLFGLLGSRAPDARQELSYSAFLTSVEGGNVDEVTIKDDGAIDGTFTNGLTFRTRVPTAVGDDALVERLVEAGVEVEGADAPSSWGPALLGLLPFVLLIGAMWWFVGRGRAGAGAGMGANKFVRSGANVIEAQRPQTTFEDVAGYEGAKAELSEVVDYLRNPERYHRAGAVGPGGVLMVGPPGTGKTHLARAVAGESDVPFFTVTASGFVELFVGVGAARVRDLFSRAREKAPSIIFIDEIDAIGSRRGGMSAGSNDEREQTLNQLLSEMDGFDPAEGVVVLAATNRPDVLDPALLRPGRFDRQVVVPLPNQAERRAILQVHARGKSLRDDVDLDREARSTPGFSGADLANLMNEAAIVAVREGRVVICPADFESARERIVLGRRDRGTVLLPAEKRLVAVHEAGHAIVAAVCEGADPVAKVSILPAGMALGVTQQLPVEERHLSTESELRAALAVRLGGRAAEQLVVGSRSSGAANDLASATDIAVRMVRELGLSDEVGPVSFVDPTLDHLGGPRAGRACAEATLELIDRQVAGLLRDAESRASALLTRHRAELQQLVDLLLEHEVVDGAEVYRLLGREAPGPVVAAAPGDGDAAVAPPTAAAAPTATAAPTAAAAPTATAAPGDGVPGEVVSAVGS